MAGEDTGESGVGVPFSPATPDGIVSRICYITCGRQVYMANQTKARGAGESARDEQIKQLSRELDRLRRENLRLSRLAGLQQKDNPDSRAEEVLAYQAATRRLMSSPSYASYLAGFVRASSPYRAWHGIVGYARRLRLLSGAARILARVVAFIETSAVLLLLASAAIILVPLLLLLFVITFITALFERKRLLHRLAGAIRDRDVYVFFPAKKEQLLPGSFYFGAMEELSRKNSDFVIAVSPALKSSAGFLFPNARRSGKNPNLYIVRRHFFFRLRKTLESGPANLTFIY